MPLNPNDYDGDFSGPHMLHGRPIINEVHKHDWFNYIWLAGEKHALDMEKTPHPDDDEDREEHWMFMRPRGGYKVNHLKKTQNVHALLYGEFIRPVNGKREVVIPGENCPEECCNPWHCRVMDKYAYMSHLAMIRRDEYKNEEAPLVDKIVRDEFGNDRMVGEWASFLVWQLLKTGKLLELWDWEQNFPKWVPGDFYMKMPKHELIVQMIMRIVKDRDWTVEKILAIANCRHSPEDVVTAGQTWMEFHEGLDELFGRRL
jgi:hypothetical protein